MTTLVQYDTPNLPTIGSATKKAGMIVIDDQTTYEIASDAVAKIKTRRKEIDGMRKSIVDPINKAKDAVQAIFTPVLADYDEAEKVIKRKMIGYVEAEEQARKIAQAAADKAARELAEAAEKKAAKLEAKGKVEEAEAIREIAAVTPAPFVAPTVEQVGGNSIRHKLVGEVTDKEAFVAFVAANPIYLNVIDINASQLNKWVAATDGKLEIPGLKVTKTSVVAVRT